MTDLPGAALREEFVSPLGHLTIRRLRLLNRVDMLLAAVHFQSKVNWTAEDQALEATVLAGDIKRVEDRVSHQRTVLVGDVNMNPFEAGMVGAQALNAVMTKDLARLVERTVAGRRYRCFYNPMWGVFGDRTAGSPGTYFLGDSKPTNSFWNVYDQVLLRPELMHALTHVEILDNDGAEPLVTKRGRPRRQRVSDHLPLHFRLDM